MPGGGRKLLKTPQIYFTRDTDPRATDNVDKLTSPTEALADARARSIDTPSCHMAIPKLIKKETGGDIDTVTNLWRRGISPLL